jgi:homoserine dehydrogenase
MTGKVWRIGVAGLGTVGTGLIKFIQERPDFAPVGGARVEIAGVSARSKNRNRGVDISAYAWFDDPVALAQSPDIDLLVELVGGSDGPAKAAVEAALRAGKPVVTANKALIAEHGLELAKLAEEKGVALLFEAAVMGGAPAVKFMREAMLGDDVQAISGILNGTCNYILSTMEQTGASFGDVLAEAQRLGYAEADPTADVGGFDTAHKITILAALAFGGAPNYAAAEIAGIDTVELLDIRMAHELGYRIKLIAAAERGEGGGGVRVAPQLVPLSHPLAQAMGSLNALFVEGRRIGRLFLQGPGAGEGPTAAAVAADIADVIAGAVRPVFQGPASNLKPLAATAGSGWNGKAYIRLMVKDQPGVIAGVSEALAKAEVSIDSILQRPVDDGLVPIVITTHPASEAAVKDALDHIAALDAVSETPRMFRIAHV